MSLPAFVMGTLELGVAGEKIALKFLESQGYTLKEQNWTFGRLEIDLIMQKEDTMVFVEVKMRASNYHGSPWQAVVLQKQRRIIKAADHYIKRNQWEGEARFDIVSIVGSHTAHEVQHITSAFYPI
ncbi:MAG: YraN family protein [Bacteroidota bacterium]